MTTINKIFRRTIKELSTPLLFFKRTHTSEQHNINILSNLKRGLGKKINTNRKYQWPMAHNYGTYRELKNIQITQGKRKSIRHNPKSFVISPVADKWIHQKIRLGWNYTEGKPQLKKVGAQRSRTGKSNGQRGATCMGTVTHNWLSQFVELNRLFHSFRMMCPREENSVLCREILYFT